MSTCVCCLENEAEELLWARRADGDSYGDVIKTLFGIEFPMPDPISMSTRICGACAEQLEQTLQLRTRLLAAQTKLAHAHWALSNGPATDTCAELNKADTTKNLAGDEKHGDAMDFKVELLKTEQDIDIEHEVGFSSSASLLLAALEDTAKGIRTKTGQRYSHRKGYNNDDPPDKTDPNGDPPAMDALEVKAEPLDIILEPDPLKADAEDPTSSPQQPSRPRRS